MKKIIAILFLCSFIYSFSENYNQLPVYMFSDEISEDIEKKLEVLEIEKIKIEEIKKIEELEKIREEKKERKKEKKVKRSNSKNNYFYFKLGLKTLQELNNNAANITKNMEELNYMQFDFARKVNKKTELGIGTSISRDLKYKNYIENSETGEFFKETGLSIIPIYLSLKFKIFKISKVQNYILLKGGYPYIHSIGKNSKTDYIGEYFYGIGSGIELWKIILEANYEVTVMKEKNENFNWENNSLNLMLGFKF